MIEWFQLFAIICVGLIVMFWKNYIPKYLEEKGKNLATKEDIAEITLKVESVKLEHNKQFDEIQKKNDLFFSEIKNSKERFNSKQFELYNQLWSSLIDLKISADDLWQSANIVKLKDLSQKVFDAKISIDKSSLLIEDVHYQQLLNLIKKFESFQFGKKTLVDLRTKPRQNNNQDFDESQIAGVISNNRVVKNSYDNLIESLKSEFKRQIRGDNSRRVYESNTKIKA